MVDTMRKLGRDFLKELLSPLIAQWGRDEVLRAIYEIDGSSVTHKAGTKDRYAKHHSAEEKKRAEPTAKLSAVMIAEKTNVPADKRLLLINLASQFEHKSFLPTISDVRNFLEMRGQDIGNIKQRPEAFRKVIKAIIDLPNENLERMIRSSRHSGPSQLGPLSDAIKAASAFVRSGPNEDDHSVDEGSYVSPGPSQGALSIKARVAVEGHVTPSADSTDEAPVTAKESANEPLDRNLSRLEKTKRFKGSGIDRRKPAS